MVDRVEGGAQVEQDQGADKAVVDGSDEVVVDADDDGLGRVVGTVGGLAGREVDADRQRAS
jgi:hypothetical protein